MCSTASYKEHTVPVFINCHNGSIIGQIDFFYKRIIPACSLKCAGTNNNNTMKIQIVDSELA